MARQSLRAHRATRATEEAKAGGNVGHMASMFKVAAATLNQEKSELTVEAHGQPRVLAGPATGFEPTELKATRDWLRSKGNSIEGGTSEINLNVIAKRVLGLRDHQ